MIDDGELDWKVIAIHSDDPLAKELHDINDVETKLHGTVSGKYLPSLHRTIHDRILFRNS